MRSVQRRIALLSVSVAVVVVLRLLIDREPTSGVLTLTWPEAAWRGFRVTAVWSGVLVGAALAYSGVLLQAALRNPLAAPSILGVSSGAGLGVMVSLYLAWQFGGAALPWPVSAAGGAAVALVVVLALGRRNGWPDPVSTILAGVIVATMCGAGMVLLQGLVPDGLRGRFLAWSLGTLPEQAPMGSLPALGAMCAVAIAIGMARHGRLDALLFDQATATSIGARPGATRLWCLVAAGALTAMSVSLCGPIAFVGLVAPHAARVLVGAAHQLLVPAAVLSGMALVVGADVVRQVVDFGSGRLPVGVLTTLVGGPLFLVLLRRSAGTAWRGLRHA